MCLLPLDVGLQTLSCSLWLELNCGLGLAICTVSCMILFPSPQCLTTTEEVSFGPFLSYCSYFTNNSVVNNLDYFLKLSQLPQKVHPSQTFQTSLTSTAREGESDELVDDNMTKTAAFTRDNPCMFALMANTPQPACDHKDKIDVSQTLTEFSHVASDIQWEPKFADDETQALSSIASDAWKQF